MRGNWDHRVPQAGQRRLKVLVYVEGEGSYLGYVGSCLSVRTTTELQITIRYKRVKGQMVLMQQRSSDLWNICLVNSRFGNMDSGSHSVLDYIGIYAFFIPRLWLLYFFFFFLKEAFCSFLFCSDVFECMHSTYINTHQKPWLIEVIWTPNHIPNFLV